MKSLQIYVKNVGCQMTCTKPDLPVKQLTMAPQDRLIEELKAKLRKSEEVKKGTGYMKNIIIYFIMYIYI